MKIERMYVTVKDVMEISGVGKPSAYRSISEFNKELEEQGYIVVPGKLSTKYFAEKVYGMSDDY